MNARSMTEGALYKLPLQIPLQWCTTCHVSLRTEGEYTAHTAIFPTHCIKPVMRLLCPQCGIEVPLENGRYAEHWVGYLESSRQVCTGSGMDA